MCVLLYIQLLVYNILWQNLQINLQKKTSGFVGQYNKYIIKLYIYSDDNTHIIITHIIITCTIITHIIITRVVVIHYYNILSYMSRGTYYHRAQYFNFSLKFHIICLDDICCIDINYIYIVRLY